MTWRRSIRRLRNAVTHELIAHWRRSPIRPDAVFYEAFAGSGMLCNPEAVFRQLRRSPDLSRLQHIWAIADRRQLRELRRRFSGEPSVSFVRYRSAAYYRALSTSGYLINNATFPPAFGKRDGQSYLNTWHGTPLKRMGYDMPNGATEAANTLRNFVSADWLLSQNPFMTDTMYRRAYKLDGVFGGRVLEAGYPRVDRQFTDQDAYLAAREELRSRGVELGDRRILLYAPTWKGERFADPHDDVAALVSLARRLQGRLRDEYTVLLKTHQSVYRYAASDPDLRRMLVPNEVPTNTVLAITDVLVTDYSSIFFDYLATDRPIVFFTPDLEQYDGTRGTYVPPSEWPGPLAGTVDELVDVVGTVGDALEWQQRRSAWRDRFAPWDDGRAAERVIDAVFRGAGGGRELVAADGPRHRVLFYVGGLKSNGITSAAVGLANALDPARYDVSIVHGSTRNEDRLRNADRFGPAVRRFQRAGGMNLGRLEHRRRRRQARPGESGGSNAELRVSAQWRDEWRRVFGDARFDTVVDFSGYSGFWARLMLASPPARRLIWLHNDMRADAARTVAGRAVFRGGLTEVFAQYGGFDALVSVSEPLALANRSALSGWYAPSQRFRSVPNVIDAEAVRQAASTEPDVPLPPCAPGELRFVTVGRLSPEKDHALLLAAFERVHAEHANTRLVVVGDGPLAAALEAQRAASTAADAIVLTGASTRAPAIVATADCFVLSSVYEGQPMVLLEAAALGLPIVTTRFGSVAGAFPSGSVADLAAVRVVERRAEALADGMLAFVSGQIPGIRFDDRVARRATLDAFDALTGATVARS